MEKTVSNEGFIKNFYYLGPTFFLNCNSITFTIQLKRIFPLSSFNLYATFILSW